MPRRWRWGIGPARFYKHAAPLALGKSARLGSINMPRRWRWGIGPVRFYLAGQL
jgi:hypothetical protein